jgi:FKBP-type peptidyl-prolyl cis-trans isomerase
MKLTSILRPLFAVILFTSILISCDDDPTRVDYSSVPDAFSIENPDSSVTLESGLQIYIVEEGVGQFKTDIRDAISFFYTKRLKENKDRILGSSYINNVTVPIPANINALSRTIDMAGLQQGLVGMKEQEKRVLVIPPDIGYGNTNSSYSQDTIWVDVELDQITSPRKLR